MFSKKSRIACYCLTLLPGLLGPVLRLWNVGPVWSMYMPVNLAVVLFILFRVTDREEKNKKMNAVAMWSIPVLSNALYWMSCALGAGVKFSPTEAVVWLMGLVFLVIGNYLPKCRQNSTVGIKLPWTFASAENWNATHRMAGPVWMAAGAGMLLGTLFSEKIMMGLLLAAIAVAVLVPTVYSYRYYCRQKQAGVTFTAGGKAGKLTKTSLAVTAVLLALAAVMCFTGTVRLECGQDALQVKVSYYGQARIPYERMDTVELRQGNVDGSRSFGLGTFRLLAGTFRNAEFGDYTRYTYRDPEATVVLKMKDGSAVVLSGVDAAQTEELYRTLLKQIG